MFVDSCVFIKAYLSLDKAGALARAFLKKVEKGEQHILISPLVLDEVCYALVEFKGRGMGIKIWESMEKLPNSKMLRIDEDTAKHVPEFLRQGLEPRDALHAAVMKQNNVSTICSFDHDFDQVKGIARQEPK